MSAPPPTRRPSIGEGGHDGLLQHREESLADERSQAELRVVETAGHRQSEPDDAVAILEQRDGEPQGQFGRVRARDLVAELQLVDGQRVIGVELAVVHFVVEIGVERAAGDLVTGEAHGIGSHARQLEAGNSILMSV